MDSFSCLPGRGIALRAASAKATMDEPSPVSGGGIDAELDALVAEWEAKRVRLPFSQELDPASPFQNSGWSGAGVAAASPSSSSFFELGPGATAYGHPEPTTWKSGAAGAVVAAPLACENALSASGREGSV